MRALWIAAAAALLLGAGACGGSSGGSTSSTSTTTTTTASTTPSTSGGGGTGGRLSAADWATYEQTAAEARSVNQTAMTKFASCRKTVAANASADQVKACFGTSTKSVVVEGQKLLPTIQGLAAKAGGSCRAALTTLYSDVKLYVSSVNALNLSSSSGTIPPVQSVDAAIGQLKQAQTAAKAVPPVCQPQ